MDHAVLLLCLAKAERHVARGAAIVIRQRGVVDDLAKRGLDTRQARGLLLRCEDLLALYISHRDRLRQQLGELAA